MSKCLVELDPTHHIILSGNLISQVSILSLFIAHTFLIWGNNDSFIKLVAALAIEIQQLSSFAI